MTVQTVRGGAAAHPVEKGRGLDFSENKATWQQGEVTQNQSSTSLALIPFPAPLPMASVVCAGCPSLGFSPFCLNTLFGGFPGPFTLSRSFSGFCIPLGGRFGIYYCCWMGTMCSHLCRSHLTELGTDCSVLVEAGRVLGSLTFSFQYSSITLVNSWCRGECTGKIMCFLNLKIEVISSYGSYDVLAQNLLILGSGSLFAMHFYACFVRL